MNVLGLFDGISCGQLALNKANIEYDKYFASEIDPYAIQVTKNNFPFTLQCGDITKLQKLNGIELLIGGSPCQDISNLSRTKLGLEGDKSSLFYHYLRLKDEINPKYFLLENVVGNKKATNIITELLEVEPILINSNIFVPQSRKRYYWTNIPINPLPFKTNIKLRDILDKNINEKYYLKEGRLKWLLGESGKKCVSKGYAKINPEIAQCLTARSDASWNCTYVTTNNLYRKLTPMEYEKLQGIPIGYTDNVSDKERYKMLGNAWTVDVIAHILSGINNE